MSPYYGPTDEDNATIEYERNFIAGDVVVGTAYGIQLVLWANCALWLWKRRKHDRQPMLLLSYMTAMLLIESLFVAVQARTVQFIYIDNRNYQLCLTRATAGGPWKFFLESQTAAVNLWRCWVIWAASGQRKLAWGPLGTLWTLESSQPHLSLYSALPMAYGTAYYAISLSSNIILTLLIIGRLVAYRRTLLESLPADLATHYISLATVVIESAALYSVFALLFLVTYARSQHTADTPSDNPTNQIWLGVASGCQQIANLLIIYRLAQGNAWKSDTLATKTNPIHFKSTINHGTLTTNTNIHSFHIAAPPASSGSSDPDSDSKPEGQQLSKDTV
ncbi:hypothetical protein R3P38DRAFT_3314332 [Favolaschia claudopus]|uniref:Uncharacterized protein n=1 Tax=Favolaschia claudopus TaxID=2862362 RepID=A0AAW0BU75_9AGAR